MRVASNTLVAELWNVLLATVNPVSHCCYLMSVYLQILFMSLTGVYMYTSFDYYTKKPTFDLVYQLS